eukprot:335791_1
MTANNPSQKAHKSAVDKMQLRWESIMNECIPKIIGVAQSLGITKIDPFIDDIKIVETAKKEINRHLNGWAQNDDEKQKRYSNSKAKRASNTMDQSTREEGQFFAQYLDKINQWIDR